MRSRRVEYVFADPARGNAAPPDWNGKTLLHVAVHRGWRGQGGQALNLNAGDTCLNPLVRRLIDLACGPFRWRLKQVWEPIEAAEMRALQAEIDGIVVGGGGLFLREQAGTDVSRSGWTWNCPIEALDEIRKPLIVFAVGYNRFRGHDEFEPIFFRHIDKVARIAAFFGLRNTGSIDGLRRYLDSEALRRKLVLQVCPTTLIWQLRPDMRDIALAHAARGQRICALNCAFDRPDQRFGAASNEILGGIARAAKHAERQGWRIRVAAHKTLDLQLEPYLDRAAVAYETHDISNGSSDDVICFYAETDLTVGLRGHSQMIPFGLRQPIISVNSHDKMRFFLDDIGHPEWGVEVTETDFEEQLNRMIDHVTVENASIKQSLAAAQDDLWRRTQPNLEALARIFGGEDMVPRHPQEQRIL